VLRNRIAADAIETTDRDKLRIVIANLISNAVEYTEPGGWIEIASGDGAVLDVIDSGPPIPPEHLERIFDRMWRGDESRAGTGVHCGIGLALARSLAGCLGMTLTAASRDDGSVRFRLAQRAGPDQRHADAGLAHWPG
jgi:signal transduction histidine kinase